MALGFDSLGGSGGFSGSSSSSGESGTGDQSFGSAFIVNQGGSSGGASPGSVYAIAGVAAVGLVVVLLMIGRR